MKLAYRVLIFTLALFMFAAVALAQSDGNSRSVKDNRNTAPTVGTGGPMGGPTGLFTVYDGQTLRKGEYTFSAALSNYDRDPGNVDLTEVPVSFQIGVTNNFEVFFNTDVYRAVKVNSPRNLSSFFLPNSQMNLGSGLTSGPAIVLGPSGTTPGPFSNLAVFRPAGSQPFVQFPFVGGSAGDFGQPGSGPLFGFPNGTNALLGPPQDVNGGSANFPGIGSVFGSILPGVVFQTVQITLPDESTQIVPSAFTLAPTYLPDAPFINRTYGESSFGTFTLGAKWRFTNIEKPYGLGVVVAYRFYGDSADDFSGFNQLQRGASAGGDKGDLLITAFADSRVASWFNVSGNLGYHLNSAVKADFLGNTFTILDRPDELLGSVGVDFPINKFFQPIAEFRATRYVGGRTPNALEKDPMDVIAGLRIYPTRWISFGVAYRANLNQQDEDFFDSDETFPGNAIITCPTFSTQPSATLPPGCVPTVVTNNFKGVPPGFQLSDNPHGYIVQFTIGRRNAPIPEKINQAANVTGVSLSDEVVTLPCKPGFIPREGQTCNDNTTVNVSTAASDPENDVLTYNYTVSGGRIVGSGANVSWDVSGLQPGTYTITSAVDDGCGFCGKAETKTITIAECDCVPVCSCPSSLTVSGPAGITNPGDTMSFTASVSGGPEVTYNWTVSGGTIEDGQGTPSITVRTSRADANTNITATIGLGGLDPNCGCVKEASETAPVASNPEYVLVDEFGKLTNDDIRARMDQFFIELQNNPANQGYIINYGTDKEIAAREKIITNHIDFRKFDRSRITLVRGGDTGVGANTKLYRIPPGASDPTP